MIEKEKRVKEQRLIEATKKNFIGLEGKFGLILKHLGYPIKKHNTGSGSGFESNEMPDIWSIGLENENYTIPYTEWEDPIFEEGLHLDALKWGMHLEIKLMHESREITVTWGGYTVYKEIEGDLLCYIPKTEWESKIEKLFEIAQDKEVKYHIAKRKESEEKSKKAKSKFLNYLKRVWGFE